MKHLYSVSRRIHAFLIFASHNQNTPTRCIQFPLLIAASLSFFFLIRSPGTPGVSSQENRGHSRQFNRGPAIWKTGYRDVGRDGKPNHEAIQGSVRAARAARAAKVSGRGGSLQSPEARPSDGSRVLRRGCLAGDGTTASTSGCQRHLLEPRSRREGPWRLQPPCNATHRPTPARN